MANFSNTMVLAKDDISESGLGSMGRFATSWACEEVVFTFAGVHACGALFWPLEYIASF